MLGGPVRRKETQIHFHVTNASLINFPLFPHKISEQQLGVAKIGEVGDKVVH